MPEAIQIDQYKKEKERQHISWEYHTWDIRRLMEASHATGLAEHMSIELPGGIATVKAPDDMEDMDTYLLFVTGDVLSGRYKKYGSKLTGSQRAVVPVNAWQSQQRNPYHHLQSA